MRAERLALGDDAFVDHVHGDSDGRGGGALGGARLEHVQLAALDGELEVLDVAVVALEAIGDLAGTRRRRRASSSRISAIVMRRADAGHDVLALGVGQVLAVEHLLAGVAGRA